MKTTTADRTTKGILLNAGNPLNMTAIYHGEFASGDPYDIPPSNWTSQIEFRNYHLDPKAGRIHRTGRPAGGEHSAGANELDLIFEHHYPVEGDPRLLWYSHKIPQYGVVRYGFLVLNPENKILDAMEWDFLNQDPGSALGNFDQVSDFLNQTVKIIPQARLLFAMRPGA